MQQRLVHACTDVGELHCWLQSLETRLEASQQMSDVTFAQRENGQSPMDAQDSDAYASAMSPEELKVMPDHTPFAWVLSCSSVSKQTMLLVGDA